MTSKKEMIKAPRPAKRYRVLTDRLTYRPNGTGVRIRPGKGAIIDDLKPSSPAWLLEAGAIEEIK